MKIHSLLFTAFAFILSIVGGFITVPTFAFATNEMTFCETYSDGSGSYERISRDTYCDYYELYNTFIPKKVPAYSSVGLSNNCAGVAGTELIAYYDSVLPNLIPNFEPGYEWAGEYYFDGNTSQTVAVQNELYNLMGTNTTGDGTTINQFKKGITSYVNNQGYNISFSSCGKFNLNSALNFFNKNIPLIIFLNSYEYYAEIGISLEDNHVHMIGRKSTNPHVAVAFGYLEFDFFKDGAVFKKDKFLIISFGDDSLGYLSIDNYDCFEDSYAITIY